MVCFNAMGNSRIFWARVSSSGDSRSTVLGRVVGLMLFFLNMEWMRATA